MNRADFSTNWSTAKELLSFIWHGRNWWLMPIVFVLLVLSGVLVFLESSAIAPFIYALF